MSLLVESKHENPPSTKFYANKTGMDANFFRPVSWQTTDWDQFLAIFRQFPVDRLLYCGASGDVKTTNPNPIRK